MRYIASHWDPMGIVNHTGEARILDAIQDNCLDSMIPVQVRCDEVSFPDINLIQLLPICSEVHLNKWQDWDDRYKYHISDDCHKIKLWDKQTATYAEFQLAPRRSAQFRMRFKGIDIRNNNFYYPTQGIFGEVDVYGMDTRDSISLDRTSFTRKGAKEAHQIIDTLVDLYKECVLKQLNDTSAHAKIFENSKFDLYTFWLLCTPNQRERIDPTLLNYIQVTGTVLVRNETGEFEKQEKSINKLIPFSSDTYFVNLREFLTFDTQEKFDYTEICKILSQAKLTDVKEVVADETLAEVTNTYDWSSLKILDTGSPLLLYTVTTRGNALSPSDETRKTILRGLSECISGMTYNLLTNDQPQRYAIPTLKEYEVLAVHTGPYGIALARGVTHSFIIAPFNREEALRRKGLSTEDFTQMVLSTETFDRVVDHVLLNSACENPPTREKVILSYQKLIGEYYDAVNTEQEGVQA